MADRLWQMLLNGIAPGERLGPAGPRRPTAAAGIRASELGTVATVTASGAAGVGMLALWLPMCRPILRRSPLDGERPGTPP